MLSATIPEELSKFDQVGLNNLEEIIVKFWL